LDTNTSPVAAIIEHFFEIKVEEFA